MKIQANFDQTDTKHVKRSKKQTMPKSDHQHEYVRVFTWVHLKYLDGKVKFPLKAECIDCGHIRRKWNAECVEVEVSAKEWEVIAARQKRGV